MERARKNKKGFTLVELIVVIVILAILAAILVPALLGWIDKAKQKQIVVDCNIAVKSAQALYSEAYAQGKTAGQVTLDQIDTLADLKGKVKSSVDKENDYIVYHLVYEKDGQRVTYCREPDKCADHSETFTFGDAESGSGGNPPEPSTPESENPEPEVDEKSTIVGDYIVTADKMLQKGKTESLTKNTLYRLDDKFYYCCTQYWFDGNSISTDSNDMVLLQTAGLVAYEESGNSISKGAIALAPSGDVMVYISGYNPPKWRKITSAKRF